MALSNEQDGVMTLVTDVFIIVSTDENEQWKVDDSVYHSLESAHGAAIKLMRDELSENEWELLEGEEASGARRDSLKKNGHTDDAIMTWRGEHELVSDSWVQIIKRPIKRPIK